MCISRIGKYRFTLVELLAVVALIGMLMALGVPAFARMIRGNKVDECARTIKLGLEQAQMRAAGERRYVAVIFPNGNSVDDALKPYRLGGFRTAYVKKAGEGDAVAYSFVRWADDGWRNAPSGAMLVRCSASTISPDSKGFVDNCTEKAADGIAGASDVFKQVSNVKDDNGAALQVGAECALIFNQYGGLEGGNKICLLVSEAAVEDGSIVYPHAKEETVGSGGEDNKNSTSNYRALKVNNLTGRVEFY